MALKLTEEQKALLKQFADVAKGKTDKIEDAEEVAVVDNQDKIIADLRKKGEENEEAIATLLSFMEAPEPSKEEVLEIDPMQNGDPSWGYSVEGKDWEAGWGEFSKDVMNFAQGEPSDKILKIKNATKAAGAGLQENVDSEGGFLIPTEQRAELLKVGFEKADLMDRVRMIPMQSNTVKLNYVKDTDRSSGLLHGGVKMYWRAEEASTTATKPALGQVTLSLNKLFGLAYATSELIEDSPISIGPWLSEVFTDALAWQMDYEILNGTGAGMPEGILHSPALISVAIETDQEATTIVAQNILNIYSRMPAANRRNAIWVANEDAFPQLAQMTITVGTSGVPVYLPANGLANQPYDTLMGKPIIFSEHCQTVGTAGDIYLLDLTQYLLGTKAGSSVRTDTSIHLKFETDEMAFRFIYRCDGKSWWPSAITPRHSSSTLSPFITIAVRS